MMEKVKGFLKKKDIVFSVKRYGIDALGAMAQGLYFAYRNYIEHTWQSVWCRISQSGCCDREWDRLYSWRSRFCDGRAGDGGGYRICS